jgi:alanyl-tRNA synthetase
MDSNEIRKKFLFFFKEHSHNIVDSSPLIPQGDPSLLFTSAGMVQFKPYYLGLKKDMKRATSCQKCFRTSDIDNVGKTIRHLTFFEMLGNFSFGDYFKEESLKWGYDFLTKEMQINPERLYFSIYKGGIAPKDEEALSIWKKILPQNLHSHIFEMGEDNFWSMGETGPSGPCSEIYYDRGEQFDHKGCKGPSCGCDRYIEIWNHVFTQFDRQIDGSFKNLPTKNIDTGMGLERLTFIIENRFSPFETSLFYPIIDKFISNHSSQVNDKIKLSLELIKKHHDSPQDFKKNIIDSDAFQIIPNLRIIADHLRGAAFLISAGVIPSNEGRGYVLRRLIRRAERFGMILGVKEAFLHELIDSLDPIFSNVYPELSKNKAHIKSVLLFEEEGFIKTLENGEKYMNSLVKNSSGSISGQEAFKLYETYGFPLELIKEIANKNGIAVDEKEFNKAKNQAQEISRSGWKSSGEINTFIFQKAEGQLPPTIFTGYDRYEDKSKLIAILDENGNMLNTSQKGRSWLVFEKTPFYAESGGQVADTGEIYLGEEKIGEIIDAQKPIGKVFYHLSEIQKTITVGMEFNLKIDKIKRIKTAANHTAIHLINSALKKILGENTRQAGSFVNHEKFRFDYTINRAPTLDELKKIEEIANNAIKEEYKVYKELRALSDAEKLGATILLGEKYSDPARFVLINKEGFKNPKDRYSLELCGGTHVDDLKDVFYVKIIKDSSVSRGIRRIEGISGYSLIEYMESKNKILDILSEELTLPYEEIPNKISHLKEEIKNLKEEIKNIQTKKMDNLQKEEIPVKNYKIIFQKINSSDIKIMRGLSDNLRNENKNSIIFVYSINEGKVNFTIGLSNDIKNSDTDASIIAKKLSSSLNIKAGGRKDFAQGGGIFNLSENNLKEKVLDILK